MSQTDWQPDGRLNALMTVLVALHDVGVITDPAVSSEKLENGTAVTVEFILDYDRGRAGLEGEHK